MIDIYFVRKLREEYENFMYFYLLRCFVDVKLWNFSCGFIKFELEMYINIMLQRCSDYFEIDWKAVFYSTKWNILLLEFLAEDRA